MPKPRKQVRRRRLRFRKLLVVGASVAAMGLAGAATGCDESSDDPDTVEGPVGNLVAPEPPPEPPEPEPEGDPEPDTEPVDEASGDDQPAEPSEGEPEE